MFFRSFYYAFKQMLRQRELVFWSLLFPIALGTLFHLAFSGLASDETFHAIPVAVVLNSTSADGENAFRSILDSLSEPGEDQFLIVSYTTEEEALTLLENKEITGILYENEDNLSLTVSAEMTSVKLEQSILGTFVEQFNQNSRAIREIAAEHPERLSNAITQLTDSSDTTRNVETSYTDGSLDESLTYFFNLISMTCLFASMSGLMVAVHNQGNLSDLGARRCVSPVHRAVSLMGELSATVLFQCICVLISLLYLSLGLKINFGDRFGLVLLASFVGCLTGVSYGFFIGCIGKLGENTKMGILMAFTMLCCFFSGLMVGSMRVLIGRVAPWFNHINPAALISDCLYALTVYQSNERYLQNLCGLLIISALFCIGGFFMVRREKYAAL